MLLHWCPIHSYPLRAPQVHALFVNVDRAIKEVHKNVAHAFDQAILNKVSRTPFDGLHSVKGDFDSFYATILQRGIDVTPL